jgi:hypothetical protein
MFRIGYDPDFAPIAFTAKEGVADGRAIRRLAAACEQAGVACEFVAVALAEQEASLANGDVDALATVAATPERKARLVLSPAFVETGAAWFAQQSFDPAVAPPRTPVVTPAKGPLVEIISRNWPHLTVITVPDYPQALQGVLDGRAAAAALNIDVGWRMCQQRFCGRFGRPAKPFCKVGLAMACLEESRSGVFARLSAALAG